MCVRVRLAPIRTRACVATAGPAKPVTHAARRHQHHTVTPTPTPNGGRGRGGGDLLLLLFSLFASSGREHRGSSVLRSSSIFPPPLRRADTQGLRAIQRRGYTRTHTRARASHTYRPTHRATTIRNRDSDLSSRGVRCRFEDDALGCNFGPRFSSRFVSSLSFSPSKGNFDRSKNLYRDYWTNNRRS